jgi:hypothetical protein
MDKISVLADMGTAAQMDTNTRQTIEYMILRWQGVPIEGLQLRQVLYRSGDHAGAVLPDAVRQVAEGRGCRRIRRSLKHGVAPHLTKLYLSGAG